MTRDESKKYYHDKYIKYKDTLPTNITSKQRRKLESLHALSEIGGDAIVTTKDDAAILSHELGHAKNSIKGRGAGNTLTRTSHALYGYGKFANGPISYANGIRSGVTSAIKESKGKKESWISKNSTWMLPTVSALPILISEGAATNSGLKDLKRIGVSNQYYKDSRKRLMQAYGTYVTALGANVLGAEVTRGVTKVAVKKALDKRKDKANVNIVTKIK